MNRNAAYVLATGLVAGLGAGHARAANVAFGGTVDLHGGYGSNPFFSLTDTRSTPIIGATLRATLSRSTAASRTDASGTVDLNYYPKLHSVPQNYTALLYHNQRVTEHLSLQGNAGYENLVNPPANFGVRPNDLQPQSDLLTIGQKTRRYFGGGNVTWEPNGRNVVQGGLNAAHADFSGPLASPYTTYGGTLGVLHTFSARTKVGIQGNVNMLKSPVSANSKSGVIGLQLLQTINEKWKLEAGANMVLQSNPGFGVSKTFGFNGSLCGTYPRYVVCVLATRTSAPSGLGGLRTETQFGGRVQHKLTARSNVSASATYDISKDNTGRFPTQKYFDGALNYQRQLTPRTSVGFAGRYQGRDYGSLYAATLGKTRSTTYSGTLNLVWNFGRTAT